MNIRKKDKGVTLIALAVTIIVILILVGVTIATLTGENGIISQATKSREKNNESIIMEKVQLAVANSYVYNGTNVDLEILNSELKDIKGLNKIPIDKNIGLPYIITYKEKGILITDNGEAR